MHRLKVMLALLLLASCGVPLASAAGVGTFSIEQTTPNVGVGQFGIATLYMDNTWTPPADSVSLIIRYDPATIQYVSTDWKVGNSVATTPTGTDQLQVQFADYTNKYPSGRVAIAAINFKGLKAGQSALDIQVQSVRSHVGVSETEFTELTPSAITTTGAFVVGQGGGTVIPTVPVGTTSTVAPTVTTSPGVTGTVAPTLTAGPNVTVTGNVTGGVTTPMTIATTVPTTGPTGITTGVPFVPVQGVGGGSEEYTGVLTRTPTVTATKTGTATTTATATVTATATPTTGTGGNVTATVTMVTPGANVTRTAGATVTTAATTAARTTTTAAGATTTRAGADALPLAAAGLAGLALLAARRR